MALEIGKKLSITANQVLYIKLGEAGIWENDCTDNGTLRLGYQSVPHNLCIDRRWEDVLAHIRTETPNPGAATRHLNQIRLFYEAPGEALWLTYRSDRLFWCFAAPGVTLNDDGSKVRKTISGWSDKSIHGELLTKNKISGKVLATQGFQGTICSVSEHDYVVHKINGTVAPHVIAAKSAFNSLVEKLIPIIKSLHDKDLETFVDLIFRQAGWSRVSVLGGTERDIDLDLMSPVTGEHIAVQIKSRADLPTFMSYQEIYSNMLGYSKFYFVTHTPSEQLVRAALQNKDSSLILWGAEELAQFAAKNGLVGWLIDKAS
jgi:hypothetical protein